MALSLFPAPSTAMPSRSNSLKRPNVTDELQGLAIHITPMSAHLRPRLRVQPAATSIQHSMTSKSPAAGSATPSPGSAKTGTPTSRHTPTSAKSYTPKKSILKKASQASMQSLVSPATTRDAIVSPLQEVGGSAIISPVSAVSERSTQSTSTHTTEQRNSPSTRTTAKVIAEASHHQSSSGRISPLLEDAQLESHQAPSLQKEIHQTKSFETTNSSVTRSSSIDKKRPLPGADVPMRSIFPVYDPTKPLREQSYYPSLPGPPPMKFSPPPSVDALMAKPKAPTRFDSAVGLFEGYEHIPAAEDGDVESLYKAAQGIFPVSGRKVQFGLHQPQSGQNDNNTALIIGLSPHQPIYDLDLDLVVRHHQPNRPTASPIAQFSLPEESATEQGNVVSTEIFPHAAATHAITQYADMLAGADGVELAFLQENILEDAHRRHASTLIRNSRQRDQISGVVTASYRLVHPAIGTMAIEVTRSPSAPRSVVPKAKISLHHPDATPAAITNGTLNLAFLDFARDACVLDLPGLVALGGHYIIDTVVSALLAVAVIENNALVSDSMTFAAPPRSPMPARASVMPGHSTGVSKKSRKDKKKQSRKSKKAAAKAELAAEGEQVDLPLLARGTIAVLGVGVKAAVFVLTTGLKVTTKVVVGASKVATKL